MWRGGGCCKVGDGLVGGGGGDAQGDKNTKILGITIKIITKKMKKYE